MKISDWINVALCVLSFLLAVISVVTVVITLRQNQRMIENATRPYLQLYGAITNFQHAQYYFVLRNFGQSSALVTAFHADHDLSICVDDETPTPFTHIVGTTLAPNQAIHVPIEYEKTAKITEHITFSITYCTPEKRYTETTVLNMSAHTDFPIIRADTPKQELRAISYTLQDMAIRDL